MRRTRTIALLAAAAVLVATPAAAQPVDPEDPTPPPGPIDQTPPTIHLDYPTGGVDGWFPGPRTVTVLVSDEGTGGGASSGVSQVSYRMTGATELEDVFEGRRGSLPVSNEGSTQIDITAFDGNGNRAEARIWVGVDRVAPTITFAPHLAQNAEYALGQRVVNGFGCWDAHSGVATCNGSVADGAPLDTSTPGSHTVTVTTTDPVGNARQSTLTYQVREGTFSVQRPPSISGTPRTGETLTATPAAFTPDPTRIEHRWYRDGEQIEDEEEASYVVRPADAGRSIHYASVPHRTHYAGTPATSSPVVIERTPANDGPAPVPPPAAKASSVVSAKARSRAHGKVKLLVTVSAAEVATGKIVVRRGKKVVGKAKLRNGRVTIVLRGLPRGKVKLTVGYQGSAVVAASTAKVRATVR
ncbi:Ig-like domain repeat protein [Nocardioides humi]|uniref:Bacterial Ig-like domain-containing protein n=1 Tax=Nocardioides humi TaxID=449461 RepID=A0ABN2AF54_9ACTN|nr:Ig-like domain repeat protein [Nocardioides humi]